LLLALITLLHILWVKALLLLAVVVAAVCLAAYLALALLNSLAKPAARGHQALLRLEAAYLAILVGVQLLALALWQAKSLAAINQHQPHQAHQLTRR
jgi:hypothetical protein